MEDTNIKELQMMLIQNAYCKKNFLGHGCEQADCRDCMFDANNIEKFKQHLKDKLNKE